MNVRTAFEILVYLHEAALMSREVQRKHLCIV